MAINQNHLFEDLDGVKCAIVEKNASKERVAFPEKKYLSITDIKLLLFPVRHQKQPRPQQQLPILQA
jgi:hypothetical protein